MCVCVCVCVPGMLLQNVLQIKEVFLNTTTFLKFSICIFSIFYFCILYIFIRNIVVHMAVGLAQPAEGKNLDSRSERIGRSSQQKRRL